MCKNSPFFTSSSDLLSFGSLRVLILIDGERFLPLDLISTFLVSSGGKFLIDLLTICMYGREVRWSCPLSRALKFLADHYWLPGGIFPNKWESWLFCFSIFSSLYAFQILLLAKVSDSADSIYAVSYINTPLPACWVCLDQVIVWVYLYFSNFYPISECCVKEKKIGARRDS